MYKIEVLAVIFLSLQVFWDMMLCCWASSFLISQRVTMPFSSRLEGVLEGLCSKCWELPCSQWHDVVSHETRSTKFRYCLLWWYGVVVTLPRFLPYLRVLLNRKQLWSEQDFCIFNSASRMHNMTVTPLRDTCFDQCFAQCSLFCIGQYIPGPWLLPSILCIIWFDILADSSLNCSYSTKAQWLLHVLPGLTFTNFMFCPHSIFMCFLWISEQTAVISLYSI